MKSSLVLAFVSLQVIYCTARLTGIAGNFEASSKLRLTSWLKNASRITFTKDWKETLHGPLQRGKEVRIEYDANRLPGRDQKYGRRAWDIFAEFKYTVHGKVHTVRLEGPDKENKMTTTIKIPSDAKVFIIWFKHFGYFSGYSYDSDHGKNYQFPFEKIVFTGDWHEYVNGSLRPGGKFQVVYDSIRLPWRDGGYHGLGPVYAWNIFARAKFSEKGHVTQQMLQGGSQGGNPIMTTIYDIPKDAKEVIMWFFFSGYIHSLRHDSNYGRNYHFALTKH